MRLTFLLVLLYAHNTISCQDIQNVLVEDIIGLRNFRLNQRIDAANFVSFDSAFYKEKKRKLAPLKFSLVFEDTNGVNGEFKDNWRYINLDSSGRISSIIIEIADNGLLINKLKDKLGAFTNKTLFKTGNTDIVCKGWITQYFCLLLLISGELNYLVYYNCDNKIL